MQFHSWLSSPFVRNYPQTSPQPSQPYAVDIARNEQFSFQVVVRMKGRNPQKVCLIAETPDAWQVRIRRVGFVPVQHHNTPIPDNPADVDGLGHIPGYVPDPLFDEDSLQLPDQETHSFWVTVHSNEEAQPGEHLLRLKLQGDDIGPVQHTVRIKVHDVVLEPRRDFHVTHWFYNDALIDWYNTDLFDERFWAIAEKYVRNVVQHGQDVLYVPIFTPPLDGVKRPTQLLGVSRTTEGPYTFDWRDVERYIKLAQTCGITHFEWTHLFTQWGVQHALRIYEGQGRDERLLWEPQTGATSDTYRAFLAQFLPELRRFLEAHDLLSRSFFHVSDEPHGEAHLANYRQARGLLKELAPWMSVMDALTEIEFARQGLTDMPIPSITTALNFVSESIPSWCYYCCGPRGEYLNRLMDTPLPKIAMHGLLFYRWPVKGFLHWGYNYWYRSQTRTLLDPYTAQDGHAWPGWAYGDTFEVYPGPDGPIDSIRWEVFSESLQDYRLLQTLGIERDDPRLAAMISFADFPKDEAWRADLRRSLLSDQV